jgi:hypothetical protein
MLGSYEVVNITWVDDENPNQLMVDSAYTTCEVGKWRHACHTLARY